MLINEEAIAPCLPNSATYASGLYLVYQHTSSFDVEQHSDLPAAEGEVR